MKKMIFALAVAAMAFASCTKELLPKTDRTTSITVGMAGEDTKTSLTGTVQTLWASGDALSVKCSDDAFHTFTLTSGAGEASAVFTANESLTIPPAAVTFYPATMSPVVNVDYSLTVTLPDTYTWSDQGINAPLIGWLNNGWDYLDMIGGVIKVDIVQIPEEAKKLVFTTDDQQVSGTTTLDENTLVTATSDVYNKITIDFSAEASASSRSFFIPVPTGTYSNFSIDLIDSSDASLISKTVKSSVSVTKGKIVYAPAIACGSTSGQTIYSGSTLEIGNWGWKQFDHSVGFSGVSAGDRLRFTLSCNAGDTYWQLVYKFWDTSASDWTELFSVYLYSGQTQLDIVLTEAMATSLRNSGGAAVVTGYYVDVDKIELLPSLPETVIWTGSASLGDSWGSLNASGLNNAGLWANVAAGKVLTIYRTEGSGYSQVKVCKSSDWTDIDGLSVAHNPIGQTLTSFTLTSAQVSSIQESGIVLQGSGFTITKITLR